jgi:hypothetical protein
MTPDAKATFGPFVTKIHSKSNRLWRRRLLSGAYARPEQHADLVLSRACCAVFAAEPHDPNTIAWEALYESRLVSRPPSKCVFAAGSMFTARSSLLHEVSAWSDDVNFWKRATPPSLMRQGRNGQTEHALERYLGLLGSRRGRVCRV